MQVLEQIFNILVKQILGRTLLGNWETDPWAVVIHLLGMICTIWWLYKLNPKIPETLGKTFGGIAIGILTLVVTMSIAVSILHLLINFALNAIASGVGNVPLIGGLLKWFVLVVGGLVLGIAVPIGIGWYILKNVMSVLQTAGDVVKSSAANYRDDEGNVKKSYSFAAILVIAGIINRPELNEGIAFGLKDAIEIDWLRTTISYTPQIINGGLAVFCLIWRTEKGTQKVVNIQARRSGEPRPDGSWACPNEVLAPVIVNGQPITNPDGSPKTTKKRCKGPQGPPYDGWNPPEARHCLSDECDHPNPYWQQCWKDQGGCGNAGEKGYGFRRNPDHVATCTKCGKVWPRLPKSTPFHAPGEDHSNVQTVAAQAEQAYIPGQPTPQAPEMPTASLPGPNAGGYGTAPAASEMPSWYVGNNEPQGEQITLVDCKTGCGGKARLSGHCGRCGVYHPFPLGTEASPQAKSHGPVHSAPHPTPAHSPPRVQGRQQPRYRRGR